MVLKVISNFDGEEVMTITDEGVETNLVKFHDGYYNNEKLVIEICEGIITYLSVNYMMEVVNNEGNV